MRQHCTLRSTLSRRAQPLESLLCLRAPCRPYLEQEPTWWAAPPTVHKVDRGLGYFAYEYKTPGASD